MGLQKHLLILLICIALPSIAQETIPSDSLKVENLEEVVITGQINPQSVEKSVVEVKVITRKDIDRQAGNTLADVLNNTLNLNITPNTATGKSGVSLFGLDSQYFKVLMDNIPIINEEGVGNNTDLTLINLDDIERIEIVEGAMGVQYGSNAVSGIINIITKKSSRNKWDITAYVQEETVGDEYEWFAKGRHIQSVKIGHNISEKLFANVAFTRNDFGGFWDDRQGEYYDENDGLRGHEWLPKLQQSAKGLLSYNTEKVQLFYRVDYLNENIDRYNNVVSPNENPATATTNPSAIDEIYTNNRFYHHLNAVGSIGTEVNYNISASYQEQTKDLERYTYFIRTGRKENVEEGDGSAAAIVINPGEETVTQNLNNYDFFATSEWQVTNRFSLRPGIRTSISNQFNPQYIGSLSAKQTFANDWELRGVLGASNRTPNYDELFTYFVDVNHDVQGNPNLAPEKGLSALLHLKKSSTLSDGSIRLKNKISFNYLSLEDRIELIVVNQTPLAFQYNNIDSYKNIGVFSENEIYVGNFKGLLGASVQGISKILDSNTQSNDDFLFNLQLNTNLAYQVPRWDTTFSIFFKYIGQQPQFVEKTNAEGNQEFVRGTTEAYSWMDATIQKSFFDGQFVTTIGSRNLFDVTSVNTTAFTGGAHNGPPAQIPLGYGRSYFLKLTYHLTL